MSSAFKAGKSARISSAESPSAKLARTVRSVTRVLEDRLPAADSLVANYSLRVIFQIAACTAHLTVSNLLASS